MRPRPRPSPGPAQVATGHAGGAAPVAGGPGAAPGPGAAAGKGRTRRGWLLPRAGSGGQAEGGGGGPPFLSPSRPTLGKQRLSLAWPLARSGGISLPPEWTGGLRDAAAGSKRRSSSSSFACQRSIYGPLSGRTQGEAQHHLTRIRKGNLRATGSTPAVALGAKSFSVQLLVAAVGHMPRPRRDPGLCMASLADLLFHVRIREQFRYEFCLREPNPASLFPAPRTIPKNKSFLNSQTRKPTWHTTLCLDRE